MQTFVLPRQVAVLDGVVAPFTVATFFQTATSTPQSVYTDAALTNAVTSITADSAGVFQKVYLNPNAAADYRVTISPPGGTPYTEDDISRLPASQAEIGAALYPRTDAEEGAGVTPTNTVYEPGDIRRYGGVVSVDCTSILTTAASCNSEVTFPAGAWVITTLPTIPTGVQIRAMPGATFTGTGAAQMGLSTVLVSREARIIHAAAADEYAQFQLFRNASYSGGTLGNVASNLLVRTVAGADTDNHEWVGLFILDNYNADTDGENVAVYGQGNRYADARTWSFCAETRDFTGDADPANGLIGMEIGLFANGTDANAVRVGLEIVAGKGITGDAAEIGYGIRIGPQNGDSTLGRFGIAIDLTGIMDIGLRIGGASGSVVGIDLSDGIFTESAIKLAQGQSIAFEDSDAFEIKYDGTGLALFDGATLLSRLNQNGSLLLTGAATTVAAGQVSLGATTAATAGAVADYLIVNVAGTQRKIPLHAV